MKKVGIVTSFMSKGNIQPLYKFMEIIKDLGAISIILVLDKEYKSDLIIEGVNVYKIYTSMNGKLISKISKFFLFQLLVLKKFFKLFSIKTWIFYLGDLSFIPLFFAKITGKKVILLLGGNNDKEMELKRYPQVVLKFSKAFRKLNLVLSDKILVFTPNLIEFWDLKNYKKKVIVIHRHYIDTEIFSIKKNINERDNLIAYIGRFSQEKGCLNYLKAVSLLKDLDANFLLIGNGDLYKDVIKAIEQKQIDNLNLFDWIPNEELPIYLNRLKLLVMPSFTEGLPTTMLESMGCGTPVLATAVGSIPDVIEDNFNGFLMAQNSPEEIKNRIEFILNNVDLKEVSINASSLIRAEFSFKQVLKKWENFFLEEVE